MAEGDQQAIVITIELFEDLIFAWMEQNALELVKEALKPAPKRKVVPVAQKNEWQNWMDNKKKK